MWEAAGFVTRNGVERHRGLPHESDLGPEQPEREKICNLTTPGCTPGRGSARRLRGSLLPRLFSVSHYESTKKLLPRGKMARVIALIAGAVLSTALATLSQPNYDQFADQV